VLKSWTKQALWQSKEYCILAYDAEYLRKCTLPPSSGLYSEGRDSTCLQMLIITHQSARHQVPLRQNSSMSEPSESQIVWTSDGRRSTVAWKCCQVTPTELCMFWGSSGFVLLYDIQLTVIVGRQPYTSKAVAVKLKFPTFLQLFAVRGIQPLKK
jgi:hypothetical protein